MLDLSKLNPAPWRPTEASDGPFVACGSNPVTSTGFLSADDAAFIALARNAFDVMMRRGWVVHTFDGHWAVLYDNLDEPIWTWLRNGGGVCDDPFTALVEADRWFKEHVEKEK